MSLSSPRQGSWGNIFSYTHNSFSFDWRNEQLPVVELHQTMLPYGQGKSYGDCCLNDSGVLIETQRMNRFSSFSSETGILRCDAGVTLAQIIEEFAPRGWFIPVTLGTKLISLGGAIANDVHGKNHHHAGSFGCHVRSLELLRSSGERLICSPTQNKDLFSATIGGIGLTGLITWAEIQLRKIESMVVDAESIQFQGIEEYFELVRQSDVRFEHTSAWIDLLPKDSAFGRGLFFRGNFSKVEHPHVEHNSNVAIPFFAPNFLLNEWGMKIFNSLYFHRQTSRLEAKKETADSFFFPLDRIGAWSRLYGRRGFFQYQFVLPKANEDSGMLEILGILKESPVRPYLAVLKTFGPIKSPGIMSFPMEGITVALDFPNLEYRTRKLFDAFDEVVEQNRGRVYLAKDARLSSPRFESFYPEVREFEKWVDPKFSSSLWRRVREVNYA